MIPKPATALRMLSQRLIMSTLPNLRSAYVVADTALVGSLMNMLAAELEEGVERRLTDIRAMQAVFAMPSALSLAPELRALVGERPAAMTLTAVNELHDRMTGHLIELHTKAESADSRVLIVAILDYLEETVARHSPDTPSAA